MKFRPYRQFKKWVHIESPLRRSLIEGTLNRHRSVTRTLLVIGEEDKNFHKFVLPKSLNTVNFTTSRTDFSADLAIKWNPRRVFEIPASARARLGDKRIVNVEVVTTGKDRVGRAFGQAFGYQLDVDPKVHVGPVVEKPIANGVHGGRVVVAPIRSPKRDCVYSLLINNVHDGYAEDIRVPIIGSTIPFCYLKYRREKCSFPESHKARRVGRARLCAGSGRNGTTPALRRIAQPGLR